MVYSYVVYVGDDDDNANDDDDDDDGFDAGRDELLAAYSIEGVIGCGGFGTVYSATRRSDGLTVRLSRFPRDILNSIAMRIEARRGHRQLSTLQRFPFSWGIFVSQPKSDPQIRYSILEQRFNSDE